MVGVPHCPLLPSLPTAHPPPRCRAKSANTRQLGPESGPGLQVKVLGRVTVRAEDGQGTPNRSRIPPSILVNEDEVVPPSLDSGPEPIPLNDPTPGRATVHYTYIRRLR